MPAVLRSVVAALLLALACSAPAHAQQSAPRSQYDLVGRCFRVVATGDRTTIGPFFFQATGLGTYLLYDADRHVLTTDGARTATPDGASVWAPEEVSRTGLVLRQRTTGARLRVGDSTRLALVPATGCATFPEAELNAAGTPFKGRRRDKTVWGIADSHLHVTAELRGGGQVISGRSFDPFGIPAALGGDEDVHGPNGTLDITGNLLRGDPLGTHDTGGWPSFRGWPTHDTNTHQQIYWRWLQRTYLAGLRLVTVQLVEDQPLCTIEPRKSHSCDEGDTIALEAQRVRALQDYVDAQSGGPGRGWFRIVETSRQARRVIERGKLAVVLGVESSNPFGCSQSRGTPHCTRDDIDRGIQRFRALGVRSTFLTHWVDNALGGAALEGDAKGVLIGAMNTEQTGETFSTGPCPEAGQGEAVQPSPPYPAGKQCNVKGLTELGVYAVEQLMRHHVMVEADHLGEVGRRQLLSIAERLHRPVVSSHTDTGGHWGREELARLLALGGFASATRDVAPKLAEDVLRFVPSRAPGRLLGVGMGTDTGGFADLPGPAPASEVAPLRYPFTSLDGKVRFDRQRTGERTFDLNTDGVAHYGLFADELAQLREQPDGRRATALLFRGAEAYLRTWALAER